QVGGSLRESGMKEAPFVWVGLDRLGYTMMGNLKPKDGLVGSFIAEKTGAVLIRLPITSDSQGRDVVFAIHPDIVGAVTEKFFDAVKLSQGDVTIGAPKLIKNAEPALIRR
ncbi:MAG TPA: hypothetical protein PLF01_00285, partial [Alphaproteobacteria bacterium]|nr:hypothetical protein [Alphaproteobacteria bacterium]